MTKGNSEETAANCTQRQGEASIELNRIREAAKKDKNLRFTSLMHHITIDLLREAYSALKRNASPGIDDVTWRQYGEELEENLSKLYQSVQSGKYRAKPSKRIWLSKPDGRQRPIGIAVLEDKIVQQAVVWILDQIYEEDFMGFSYGFRPGRSAQSDPAYSQSARERETFVLHIFRWETVFTFLLLKIVLHVWHN